MTAEENRKSDADTPEQATEAAPVRPWTVHAVPVDEVRALRLKYLRPGGSDDDVVYKTDDDPTAQHFAAKDEDGNVVGVGSMHVENRVAGVAPYGVPGMRIRGMAVEETWRGRGVGADIIRAMVRAGCEAGMTEAWANARTANLGFYQRTRFKPVSSAFEIPRIGEHVVMARSLEKEAKKLEKQSKEAAEGE